MTKTISEPHKAALAAARRREIAEGKPLFGGVEGEKKKVAATRVRLKGKQYEDIYGDRAVEEAEKRSRGNVGAHADRDDYTCGRCGERSGKLHAHHVKSWADHPDERYDVENGLTLHQDCHKALHRELRKATTA